MRLALFAAASAGLLACCYVAAPASAAPAGISPLAKPASVVEEVRMRRRKVRRRGRSGVKSENSKYPERPVGQQNTGNTTGGPSR